MGIKYKVTTVTLGTKCKFLLQCLMELGKISYSVNFSYYIVFPCSHVLILHLVQDTLPQNMTQQYLLSV